MADHYTQDFETVIAAEREHIRQDRPSGGDDRLRGLAFSGGGIRSASFCLGVMQALAGARVLEKMDYLSTASGGGYIGTALTWFLNRGMPDGNPAGTDPDRFPFGRPHVGARNQKGNPNAVLDYLRQHGLYLTPGDGLDFTSFAAYAVRTVLVSFAVYFALITVFMVIAARLGLFSAYPIIWFPWGERPDLLAGANPFMLAVPVLAVFFVVLGISYSLITRLPGGSSAWRYSFRVYSQITLGVMIKLAGVALVLGSLPLVEDLLDNVGAEIHTAGASTGFGTLIGWYQYYRNRGSRQQNGNSKSDSATSIVASALIIYGFLLGAYIIAEDIIHTPFSTAGAAAGLAALIAVVGLVVNINYSSVHRMYRDRLMEAFTPDAESVCDNRWGFARRADTALIETMCRAPHTRPYHLINTNLVLVDSSTSKYRGRGGDNFILSPLYCGSDATGWRRSSDYMKRAGRGMTLSTAMAISGAAINPNAGNNGRGVTRNRWVSILYSLLNLRLGYWAVNPRIKELPFYVPNYFKPALSQSILTRGLNEHQRFVELSDGGHFDNTAVYELVRRKLPVIVLCDGGCDPDYAFEDLGNVIERVRVDFGARILFDDPDYDLRWVQPGTAEYERVAEKYGTARRGFAVARIEYADGSEGRLVYIKSTLIDRLPADVFSYKSDNPDFPHQATADQFFDEVQIEAYRETGYYLGWQMLEANAGVKPGEPVEPGKPGLWI